MKVQAAIVACLLTLFLSGCIHKAPPAAQPLAPPIVDTPPPPPDSAPKDLPPPVISVPNPTPAPDTTQSEPPKPPVKHKKPASKPVQQASNEAPEVSAIGQLSSGAPQDLRQRTANSIASTEHGLNNIGRTLNDQEKKTAVQIREFLKQARDALASGDVEGARTLAAKAKVLLGELAGNS